MARTDHGISLGALVEQPGASFRITKSGSDTGTRTFICDRALAAALAPAKGTADAEFPSMVVEDVDISFTRNGLAQLVVSYTGTVKDPTTTPETQTGIIYRLSALLDFYEIGTVFVAEPGGEGVTQAGILYATKYIPTVYHTYNATTFPAFQVGEYRDPPAHADKLPPTSYTIPQGIYAGYVVSFTYSEAGWRLHNRDVETTGSNHEVSDTYIFDFKVREVRAGLPNQPQIYYSSVYTPPK